MSSIKRLLVIAVFIASYVVIAKANDSKAACETLIQCFVDKIAERKNCDAIRSIIESKWPSTYDEHQQSVQDKIVKLSKLQIARRLKKINCLQDALGNTTIASCNQYRINDCAKLVSAYKPRQEQQAADSAPGSSATEEKAKLQNDLNECQAAAATREAKCMQLAECCSEDSLCNLKYQTYPESAQLASLQFALQIENRPTACPAPPAAA